MDLACSWKIACSGGGTLVKSNWEKYRRVSGEKQLIDDDILERNIYDILEKSSPDTEVVCPGQPDWCAGGRAWSWVWVVRGGWLGPRHGVGPRPPNTTISPTPGGDPVKCLNCRGAAPLPGKCQMLIDFWLGVHTIIIRREANEWGYIWMTFARVQSSLMQLKEQLWFDLHTFICLFAWLLFSSWFVCLFVSLLAC